VIRADLHVHSCLSPCADITMVPGAVCSKAKQEKIDVLSICDHNSCENLDAFEKACGAIFLPGVEVTSKEEVHVLAYFPSVGKARKFCEVLNAYLPKVHLDPEVLGYQLLVNEKDEFLSIKEEYLLVAADLSVGEIVRLILGHGGVPAYAHVDRQFGLLYQLGMFPPNDEVRFAEVRTKDGWQKVLRAGYIPLTSSDAHRIDEIGCRYTRFDLDVKNTEEFFNFLCAPDRSKVLTIWD